MLKTHQEPPKPKPPEAPVFLALGFRPFFLLGGIAAVVLMTLWLGIWQGWLAPPDYYGSIGWHTHEMLFGYAAAVIAGFLLTAVRNWTGVNTPSGLPLLLLALLWLAGRLAPFLSHALPAPLIALIDIAFLPATALAMAPALWRGQQKVNRIFVPLLLLMALTNLYVHLQALGISQTAQQGTDAMLFLVIGLISLLGGRVIPFFSEAVGADYSARRYPKIELASVLLLSVLLLSQLTLPNNHLTAGLAAGIALTQSIRLYGWYDRRIWQIPVLWVLYCALLWIITGFLLLALASLGQMGMSPAKHALTVGGIGLMTLGMMARVALGHTGRPIQPTRIIELCFVGLNLSALLRVFGPMLVPQMTAWWIQLAGVFWVVVFGAFCLVYLPILTRPRVDGKPG